MTGVFRRLLGRDAPPATEAGDLPVRLVFALGNPGKEYAHNRRNVGFWVVDRLAKRHGLQFATKTGAYALAEGQVAGRRIAIARTRTYNNDSGRAVMALISRLKLDDARELLVVCDHLDLPTGRVRVRRDGSGGGQKGVADIIARTRTDAFPRVRIGIGRPTHRGLPTRAPEHVAAWVLGDPAPNERRLLEAGVERAVAAVECVVAEGVEAAMSRYNRDDGGETAPAGDA